MGSYTDGKTARQRHHLMPSIVTLVSAMLVDSTTLRTPSGLMSNTWGRKQRNSGTVIHCGRTT